MQALRTAQKNIKLARDEVEEMLGHLDIARQVTTLFKNTYLYEILVMLSRAESALYRRAFHFITAPWHNMQSVSLIDLSCAKRGHHFGLHCFLEWR